MHNQILRFEEPKNEPILPYAPGSNERARQLEALKNFPTEAKELQNVVNGERISSEQHFDVRSPHDHKRVLGRGHIADPKTINAAIDAALRAKKSWSELSFEARASVFSRAAELIAYRYRFELNAATMLGQSKTVHQAEIDAACELIDFLRFNVHFANRIYGEQPLSAGDTQNRVDYRPLDGFVLAITPFNFTAIAANLPAAPALMGNTVIWKPSPTQALAAQLSMEIFEEAGLPPGVINLVHGVGPELAPVLKHRELAGVHFTGSTKTFQYLWQTVGENIQNYRSYPRLVGETGGKDFIVAHPTADAKAVAVAMVRGAFEFQGQKCSAASRAYLPKSLWPEIKEMVVNEMDNLKMGDVSDFSNFMGAVIDERSFDKISTYLSWAKNDEGCDVLAGGEADKSQGYFVQPTLLLCRDPKAKTMVEEIFGPILSVYVYDDEDFEATLELVDNSTDYALTGAFFARDANVIDFAHKELRFSAGNYYINDKPTGAVVGQQPFGGGRSSGTNDKAGSIWNLLRWVSPRTIKENLCPPHEVGYAFMKEE